MKVIKATKSFQGGKVTKLIYIPNEFDDNEIWEEEFVRNWADNEPSGQNYGYRVEWDVTEDPKEIKRCLDIEKEELNDTISNANEKLHEIDDALQYW